MGLTWLITWAWKEGHGAHPRHIRRTYSWPLLHALFDAHFWATYSPPPDGSGPKEVIDAEAMDADAYRALFA